MMYDDKTVQTVMKRMREEMDYVNEIVDDIVANGCSWEVLEYVNNHYAEVEIDHYSISDWNKRSYEMAYNDKTFENNEIRVNFGSVYQYFDVYGDRQYDRYWNDTLEEYCDIANEFNFEFNDITEYVPFVA